jgi:hypothetical protein
MKRQRRTFHQPRNAFGYLIGFGEAAAEYYRRRDEEQANGDR